MVANTVENNFEYDINVSETIELQTDVEKVERKRKPRGCFLMP